MSTTATAITGDITLTDTRLTFSNQTFISLEPIEQDPETGETLFKVTSRDNPALLNGNLLCGQKPIDYLVVRTSQASPGESEMQLTAYYYPEELRLSDLPLGGDDLERSLCALYTYISATR